MTKENYVLTNGTGGLTDQSETITFAEARRRNDAFQKAGTYSRWIRAEYARRKDQPAPLPVISSKESETPGNDYVFCEGVGYMHRDAVDQCLTGE